MLVSGPVLYRLVPHGSVQHSLSLAFSPLFCRPTNRHHD